MKPAFLVAVVAALLVTTSAQSWGATASPASTAAPLPAWTPIPMPSPPPLSDAEVNYRLSVQQVAVSNMMYAIFAPYCAADGGISAVQLNNTAASPAYPVTVTCVKAKLRVDAPDKVTKLP